MNVENLTRAQRQHRQNIRNFLLVATKAELQTELQIRSDRNDPFGAACVQELIDAVESAGVDSVGELPL